MQITSLLIPGLRFGVVDSLPGLRPASGDFMGAVEDVFDLSATGRDFYDRYTRMGPEDQQQFLDTVALLLKQGIVGTEIRRVDGRRYESFISVGIGDPMLKDAPYYHESVSPRPRYDLLA